MKKTIVFDFDGTLVDSNKIKEKAFVKIYGSLGQKFSRKITSFHKNNLGVNRYKKFEHINLSILKIPYDINIGKVLSDKFSNYVINEVVNAKWINGAEKFLKLNYNYKNLLMFSATPHSELKLILEKRKMLHYFKDIKGAPTSKKKILSNFISFYKLNKKDCLVVGDSMSDYNVAKFFDIDFIGISSVNNHNFPLKTVVIDDIMKLKDFVT